MKLKEITLSSTLQENSAYSYKNLQWSIATPADEDGQIKTTVITDPCREELICNMRYVINNCLDKTFIADEYPILFDKTRLLAFRKPYSRYVAKSIQTESKKMLKELKYGINFVHLFENMKGWNKTDICPVKCLNDKCTIIYNIIGPPQWIFSPFSFSLYILLLRLGTQPLLQKKVRSRKAFFRLIKNFLDPKNKEYIKGSERANVLDTYEHWFDFIANFEHIFEGRTPEYNYGIDWAPKNTIDKEDYEDDDEYKSILLDLTYGEGITAFVKGKTHDKELVKRYQKYRNA